MAFSGVQAVAYNPRLAFFTRPMTAPAWLAPLLTPLLTRKMLICIFTGFASGLPLYLLVNLLPAWLRSEGVDLTTIGFFALIQFPYTWRFLCSPLLEVCAPVPPAARPDADHPDRGLLSCIGGPSGFDPRPRRNWVWVGWRSFFCCVALAV